ncbi:MAG: tetratricopeptide repeat protein [Elusimicrobiaceae bacterium]|nr:tetratricopeptide repeat protein [Elusimicrobiaceae bacterium]
MKKLILVFSLWFTCMTVSAAQDLATQAESFYRAGQYAQALSAYEQELKKHPNSPYLYYNIGNCYFKMGSKGLAAANYFRAFKLRPQDSDIRHNLSLALAGGGEPLVPAGMPVALHKAFFILPIAELKGLVCALGWLVCILLGLWLLTRRGGKLTIVLGVLLLTCSAWLYMRHSWETQPLAVVAAPLAEVRSGPGPNFPTSASVQQGHLVEVLDSKDNWQQIIVRSQGLKGWVENTALERI